MGVRIRLVVCPVTVVLAAPTPGLSMPMANIGPAFAPEPATAPPQMRRSRSAEGLPPFEALRPATIKHLGAAGSDGIRLAGNHLGALKPVVGGGLSDVRIHTGRAAAETADALGAEAFTIGRDIFFAHGKFDPASTPGRALLAHELTHVWQQTGSAEDRVSSYGGAHGEAEAEAAEQAVVSGESAAEGLTIGRYVRQYASADGRPLTSGDKSRLDEIAFKALRACRQLLGPELTGIAGAAIPRLSLDLSVHLDAYDDEQAALHWGQALALKIKEVFGAGYSGFGHAPGAPLTAPPETVR